MAKLFTRAEVSTHTGKNEPYIIIHNKVYNVTEWLNDHPGGNAILMENAGTDATQAFEDQGHSHIARELMDQFSIGECVPEECQLWIRMFKELDTKRVKVFEFHYSAKDHLRVSLKEKLQEIYREHGISLKDIRSCLLTCKGTDNKEITSDDELEDAVFPVHVKYLADGAPRAGSIVPKLVVAGLLAAAYVAKAQKSGPISALTYSRGVRHAHALMAMGLAGSIASVQAATRAEEKETKKYWIEIHKGTGVVMLLAMLARVGLRLQSAIPPRFPGPAGLKLMETASHRAFYALMLILPTSGLVYGYYGGEGVPILGLAKSAPTKADMKTSGSALDLHRTLGRIFEYVWLPFHFGVTGFHYNNGRDIVRKITPFV